MKALRSIAPLISKPSARPWIREALGMRVTAAALVLGLYAGPLFPLARAGEGKVNGTVLYEKIPYMDAKHAPGLQLDNPLRVPVVGAKVELLTASRRVLGTAQTDGKGAYQITWSVPETTQVYLRVYAHSENVTVIDLARNRYSIISKTFPIVDGPVVQDILALDKNRGSGPFNILEVIRRANDRLRLAEPGLKLSPITIHWSTTYGLGGEGTFFRGGKAGGGEAFIRGVREMDSDEFDDSVILHEYGHFLMRTLSRDQSIGGGHGRGDKLDPRVAWSEGVATFLASAFLNDPHYVDTGRNESGIRGYLVFIDLRTEKPFLDSPGYWSEHTVSSSLWHMLANGTKDRYLGLGLPEMWRVLRGPLARQDYVSLTSFCDALVQQSPGRGPGVATLLTAYDIHYKPGMSPSVDPPCPRPLLKGIDQKGVLDSFTSKRMNVFDASAFFTLSLPARKKVRLHLDITASDHEDFSDLDLFLFNRDGSVPLAVSDAANKVGGEENIEMELDEGRYLVQIKSWAVWGTRAGRNVIHWNTASYRLRAEY